VGRAVHKRLALQISTSNYVARVIGEPSTVLWNAVQPVDLDDAPHRHNTVLLLQRLEPEKATDVAVRAWAVSRPAAQGWVMQIAGSGSQREELEELAKHLGVQDSIHFLGHVKDTKELLSQAGLLMATGTMDAFGLSVAEAMALGTPVLASDGGAHPELMGSDGWVFPAGDAEAAAEQLNRFTQLGPAELDAYGSVLRERQRTLFNLRLHVTELDRIYADLTSNFSATLQSWLPTSW
jgi:glycosyltransferase involved in cell wall biosynthesis